MVKYMIEFAPGMRTIIRDEELKGLQQIGPPVRNAAGFFVF